MDYHQGHEVIGRALTGDEMLGICAEVLDKHSQSGQTMIYITGDSFSPHVRLEGDGQLSPDDAVALEFECARKIKAATYFCEGTA